MKVIVLSCWVLLSVLKAQEFEKVQKTPESKNIYNIDLIHLFATEIQSSFSRVSDLLDCPTKKTLNIKFNQAS